MFERPTTPTTARAFLRERGWIADDEPVLDVSPAGEGNMNLVLRIRTDRQSRVLKLASPFVERYPSIPAPVERSSVEARFYAVVERCPTVRDAMPRLLASDADAPALWFEDLGDTADLTEAYRRSPVAGHEVDAIVAWMSALHALEVPADPILANRAMRALNHEHVFALPFDPSSGVDLDGWVPGLADLAHPLRSHATFRGRVALLGERYLADGTTLVHGDLHLGSVVRAPAGLRVLDPEFAFLGEPEWDPALLVAHLVLAGGAPEAVLRRVIAGYVRPLDHDLVRAFAGIEILRRLLGVARVPKLKVSLQCAARWIVLAQTWVAP